MHHGLGSHISKIVIAFSLRWREVDEKWWLKRRALGAESVGS